MFNTPTTEQEFKDRFLDYVSHRPDTWQLEPVVEHYVFIVHALGKMFFNGDLPQWFKDFVVEVTLRHRKGEF